MKSERGITVVELLVAIVAGMAVLLGSFTVLNGTLRGSARITQRIDATQRARPALTHILDELHSACVASSVPPILAGSTGSSMTFLHKTGSAATLSPDKRTISLTGSNLSEWVYPYSSGATPNWTFASTAVPSTGTRLLTNVGSATIGGTTVPLFRYYAFASGGLLDPTPLTVPLSAADAAKAVQVTVAFAVSPSKTQVVEAKTAVSVTDTALFRFTPTAENASASNLPCA
jgi:hypothetical protein